MNASQTRSLSTIVLAGGQSSRMGRDKALIAVRGVPLLQQICDVALQCASQVYVVTPWPQRYQEILPSRCILVQEQPLPGETVKESPHGPLVGFSQGLAQVQTEWALLLACDLPQLRVDILQNWSLGLEDAPKDAIALLARHPKGWEPLCGFYRRSCLAVLTEYIDGGGRSFQGWLAQNSVEELPLSDRALLFNCNTPDDLKKI